MNLEPILKVTKGIGWAAVVTLLGMALLAGAVVMLPISDSALVALNQVLKAVGIFTGTHAAVGVGGRRGLLVGVVIGMLYMLIGFAVYCAMDNAAMPSQLALEMGLGAALGGASGAVVSNLRPKGRRGRAVGAA